MKRKIKIKLDKHENKGVMLSLIYKYYLAFTS